MACISGGNDEIKRSTSSSSSAALSFRVVATKAGHLKIRTIKGGASANANENNEDEGAAVAVNKAAHVSQPAARRYANPSVDDQVSVCLFVRRSLYGNDT
jgi:hypothetical protein